MSIVGNNKIVAPVSIADLQTMLSSGDNSVKNLCQNQNIRMWAKFRPVEYKTLGRTGNPYMKQIADSNRANVAYGISCIPVWASTQLHRMTNFWSGYNTATANIPNTIDQDGNTKIQQIPTGGYWQRSLPTTFGRLTDFASSVNPTTKGYFHGAREPIGGISDVNIEITPAGFLSLNFTKNEEGVSEGLTVTYEDLVSCGMLYGFPNNANIYNYYFGVALVKLNSSDQPRQYVRSMSNTDVVAEDYLATIIANYGNRTHRLVQLSVRDSLVGSPTPDKLSTGLETMFPLAISHDWREDITTLTLISI